MLSGLVTRTNVYEYCNNDISDTECIKMYNISFFKNNKNNETIKKSYSGGSFKGTLRSWSSSTK